MTYIYISSDIALMKNMRFCFDDMSIAMFIDAVHGFDCVPQWRYIHIYRQLIAFYPRRCHVF